MECVPIHFSQPLISSRDFSTLYNPTYQVWICTAPCCQYAVTPSTLLTYLRASHRSHPTMVTCPLRDAALEAMFRQPWADPVREHGHQPAAGDPPVLGLLGSGRLSATRARAWQQACPANRVVFCQRFYITQAGSHFFKVTCTAAGGPAGRGGKMKPVLTPAELVRARVDQALLAGEAAAEVEDGQVPALATYPTKISLWLELTRWPEYLRGQDLTIAALLGCLPDYDTEPLLIHLRPMTYHRYYQVWQSLVCFAYWSSRPDQAIWLR
ncbi:hypothetical protein ASPVEDRAFT_877786 [Aspergillus versicolor CBS 583.65]|uniref:Uncharacterized protein n=1 Tax=Aspergillus versicolor CBS 583.65 TaxID=1036611 RepID=A0A1L9Q1R4_ASPVE|nr:uncharacterized protein ASPVEDRAFT_877786 [Aspergillus versicolor CBS 583.65]OJJ07727.1 hypothetical protein ASPVEDRAFT_877786 [Aspergillus versicolor CBS 583.65]